MRGLGMVVALLCQRLTDHRVAGQIVQLIKALDSVSVDRNHQGVGCRHSGAGQIFRAADLVVTVRRYF